jgi:phenylalanyl-tRNA synthetase alpha chain
MEYRAKLDIIYENALSEINRTNKLDALFVIEKKYLGRKGKLTEILKDLKNLDENERKAFGQQANRMKKDLERMISEKRSALSSGNDEWNIDPTIPGVPPSTGKLHILTQVRQQIEDIFLSMGFSIADGPEIENEFYNFDALNIPPHHPARDMQDTFFVKNSGKEKLALRSQTSAIQARYMKNHKPPFKLISPGRCFRNESVDSTHEHTFYQFEALVVGGDINVGHLKNLAQDFFSAFFEQNVRVRLRPSYFPFTEPSFEFDISCLVCGHNGCSACKHAGWIELGGAGMVNQNVFVAAGYPRNKYQGFAWGFGLERLAMMKYKINDVRLFHGGDLRFIRQF